jgi:hypothetical protein
MHLVAKKEYYSFSSLFFSFLFYSYLYPPIQVHSNVSTRNVLKQIAIPYVQICSK